MLNKKLIDIYLHFITTKPGKGSVLPKKQNFPVDMKSIIPQFIAFTTSDINTDMSLQSMESLLSTLINIADINGFDRIKHRHYLDKKQFFSGSYLYGIVDESVDIDDSPTSTINKAWITAKDETVWNEIVKNAKEEYEPVTILGKCRTRNGLANVPRVKQVLVSRTLHLVAIVTAAVKLEMTKCLLLVLF